MAEKLQNYDWLYFSNRTNFKIWKMAEASKIMDKNRLHSKSKPKDD